MMELFNYWWQLKAYIQKHRIAFLMITIPLIVIVTAGMIYKSNIEKQKREELEEQRIHVEYYEQNRAFGLSDGGFHEGWDYIGADKLDVSKTAVGIYVYNNQMGTSLTVQEVIEYLSKEYAEDGTLMIIIRPTAISGYIDWYYAEGKTSIKAYTDSLEKYIKENGYECDYTELSLEELQKIFPLVSE